MDTHDKIREIKEEYRGYLVKKHPNWSESTLSTHLSDAFFIWNNTVLPGFWKVFVSDESMVEAREAISDFLQNDTKSDKYEERTAAYFKDLTMMKEFFDSEHGGVANRIGSEFDAEEVIYDVCKRFYNKTVYDPKATYERNEDHGTNERPHGPEGLSDRRREGKHAKSDRRSAQADPFLPYPLLGQISDGFCHHTGLCGAGAAAQHHYRAHRGSGAGGRGYEAAHRGRQADPV